MNIKRLHKNHTTQLASSFRVPEWLWKPLLLLFIIAAFLPGLQAQSGAPAGKPPTATQDTQKLKIETAQVIEYFKEGEREKQKLSGNVRMRQEDILVYCDTAIMFMDDAILIGNVVIEQGDSVKVFSDSTHYHADTKIADLYGNIALENGKQKLFTRQMRYDAGNKIAEYHTGAVMDNGKSQLKSKHGYYHVNEKMVFFKGDVVTTDPDFTMRTDTMTFNTETQTVNFVAPTLISQRDGKIYTEGGFYDIENNFAEFDLNPQYDKEGQRGRAEKMRYNGTSNVYTLQGDAYIDDPTKGQETKADVIFHMSDVDVTILKGNAFYKDSVREIYGEQIRYDNRNKNYQLLGRGKVIDGSNIIEADSLDFNDALGSGLAVGRVEWIDTAGDYTVLANRMDYNKKSEYLFAYGGFEDAENGRPMMKSLIDRDTLYMSADTLTSFKPDSIHDERILLAFRDVRIFKKDLQAVCDSLKFSSADSIFWFYPIDQKPLMWSDTSQFSADTMLMLMKNKQVDRIWLRQNAMVVNSEEGKLFNQIKGRTNTIFFRDSEAKEMLVEGNAQAIYYALDDKKAYVGVNETACSEMKLYFEDRKVQHIKFYEQPTWNFIPMSLAGKETKKLDGFFWEQLRRPRSIEDLLFRKIIQVNPEEVLDAEDGK
ncbi:MAG: OstA-like protein [Saprospiraceae bacterium]